MSHLADVRTNSALTSTFIYFPTKNNIPHLHTLLVKRPSNGGKVWIMIFIQSKSMQPDFIFSLLTFSTHVTTVTCPYQNMKDC